MKNRTPEEVLRYTFGHLEAVLQGRRSDRDGFARETAMRAESLYTRPEGRAATAVRSACETEGKE